MTGADGEEPVANRLELLRQLPGLRGDIAKRTVKDQIADKLSYMICSGLLRVGDELPSERELSGLLDVSRETVRGAIQVLAGRGMIEVSQGARTRVINADDYTLAQSVSAFREIRDYSLETVHGARRAIEVVVLARAAERIDDATLGRLATLLSQQSSMFDDPVRFQISDREFHEAIYRSCGNPLLANMVGDLYAYALDFRRRALKRPGAIERSWREHQALFEALCRRDPDAAVAAIAAHLDSVHITTLDAMEAP